ncbi:F-type conjugal transfer protein TraH [Pantoea sp. Bo_2]|uniref:F-type conjugal transfer protein TraH n=2 Tax=Pantoea TaxID=53335 RepID=A0AB34CDF5_9GAMM|nr:MULTISPECIES: conjugal transfer pilus assembly protein TraH [Pantoea]KAA5922105.1 F-type conjugal transfer protein TraH [Pantoea sp. VH_8]KAA5928498.1 F-type conjugal transfer protein TraH [Pantoea sp. VH_4]KAA5937514.1 F-type conjugal transfer protein TraH [Pantoea sp. VH_3]KAA5948106.1 F-type conjugal transfer protein TraH [Pantoea sp. VH_25]KAA5977850.1 F-type conjugal transfer protein TraH [Pantoea sp. M_3]
MRKLLLAGLLSLACCVPAHAGVDSDLNNYFNRLGFEGNATGAAAWQGQAAGYVTGGNLFLRNQVKQVQVMSFTPPSLTAGCGGIDAYLGAFSFINSDQLQQFVKNLMANAQGYFFDLALQTVAPELKDAKDYLQKIATDLNSTNISSCQAAQGIIGGLWPKTQVSQQKVCQDIAGESNLFADWAASRQGCTTGGQMDSVMGKASASEKDQVLRNKNLMWEILNNNAMFGSDMELKELVMNLTGTMIYDGNGIPQALVPQADHPGLIRALMHGGSLDIQTCVSTGDCLKMNSGHVTVSESNALVEKVKTMINSIRDKLRTDEALSATEKGFIQSTSVPVLRYLIDPMQLNLNVNMLSDLSDYIAYDILLQYLKELTDQARMQMASRNYPEPQMEALRKNVSEASAQLEGLQQQVQTRADALTELDRQMSYLRQQTSGQLLERYQQNYRFAGSEGGL